MRSGLPFIVVTVEPKCKSDSSHPGYVTAWRGEDKDTKLKSKWGDFPGGAVVENPPANAGDTGSSPGLGRSHMPRSD